MCVQVASTTLINWLLVAVAGLASSNRHRQPLGQAALYRWLAARKRSMASGSSVWIIVTP